MKTFVTLAVLSALVSPLPAQARGVFVELFTSQGCSSCPPADRVMADLAGRDDVVALSLHVDYWDYLGWRDTFGDPAFAARQRAYRDSWGKRVIYTPQAVVQGTEDVLGSDRAAIDRAIKAAAQSRAEIAIAESGGMLVARLSAPQRGPSATILVAKYRREAQVDIQRGELAGQSVTYTNIALGVERIGPWDGQATREVMLPQPGPGEGVAVWLQQDPGGPVLAAAKFEP